MIKLIKRLLIATSKDFSSLVTHCYLVAVTLGGMDIARGFQDNERVTDCNIYFMNIAKNLSLPCVYVY